MIIICFDLEFTWGMQGDKAPWGKEKGKKQSQTQGALAWMKKWSDWCLQNGHHTSLLNFSESAAHYYATVVLCSLTIEPPPVLGGIHLQKPLFG